MFAWVLKHSSWHWHQPRCYQAIRQRQPKNDDRLMASFFPMWSVGQPLTFFGIGRWAHVIVFSCTDIGRLIDPVSTAGNSSMTFLKWRRVFQTSESMCHITLPPVLRKKPAGFSLNHSWSTHTAEQLAAQKVRRWRNTQTDCKSSRREGQQTRGCLRTNQRGPVSVPAPGCRSHAFLPMTPRFTNET